MVRRGKRLLRRLLGEAAACTVKKVERAPAYNPSITQDCKKSETIPGVLE